MIDRGSVSIALLLTACSPALPDELLVRGVGLAAPEAVVHDPFDDLYLISNAGGGGGGGGFVSRLRPDGSVVAQQWIRGLDAPRGLAIVGDRLWVADRTRLRFYDRRSGAALGDCGIDGAEALDDVIGGPAGGVFVSDRATGAIYRYDPDSQSLRQFARSASLVGIAGIAFGGAGDLFAVAGGQFWFIAEGAEPAGAETGQRGLAGVVRTADGRWLATSRDGGALIQIEPTGAGRVLVDGLDGPARLGYDASRARVLIPLSTGDALLSRRL